MTTTSPPKSSEKTTAGGSTSGTEMSSTPATNGTRVRIKNLRPSVQMVNIGTAPAPFVRGWTPDERRGSRHERGYGTAWDHLRKRILERDRYLCQCWECKATGRLRPASEVDHIIGKAEWKATRPSMDGCDAEENLQAINRECHRLKTQADNARLRRTRGGMADSKEAV
jgi:5-methylcytosine-specific restriction protein A